MIVVIDNFVREEKQMLLFPHLYFHDLMPVSISQCAKILNFCYV